MIPYILSQEEVVRMVIEDPALFERLVQEEETDQTAYSKKDLTAKIDAASELASLDSLDVFEKPFWSGPEVDLTPVLDATNQLTRSFAVYLGNASTLFDKSFEEFMGKFRRSLEKAGLELRSVDFLEEDVVLFREDAGAFLAAGEFLQAFTYDRLLSSQIMMDQVVRLPAEGFTLREDLIRQGLSEPRIAEAMTKFVLRISYISQGAWDDLFSILARLACREPGRFAPARLVDLIERDIVFACNFLCASYAELRQQTAAQRRSAVESRLEKYGGAA